MQHRYDIQILRGAAVLLVVLYHLQTPFLDNGFLGVDIFFVISGFLMAKIYNSQQSNFNKFYLQRLDRLLPAYTFTIILTLIASIFILVPVDFDQLYEQAISANFFTANILFWTQTPYFEHSSFKPLLHLWSLGVEAQFYLLVPFIYPFLRTRKYTFLLIIAVSFLSCFLIQIISPKTSFFMMPFRIWEFLLGAYLAINFIQINSKEKTLIQLLLIIFLILVILKFPISLIDKSIYGHPGLASLIICSITAGIIYFGIPKNIENSIFGKLLYSIGNYSYSIYLVHFPIIILVNYSAFGGTNLHIDNARNLTYILIAIIVASYLLYNLIEKNSRLLFNNKIARILLILSVLIVAIVSNHFNVKKYTDDEKKIFSSWKDRGEFRCGQLFRILHPLSTICNLNSKDKKYKIILIGNSHVDAIKDEFTKVADSSDVTTFLHVHNNALLIDSFNPKQLVSNIKKLGIQAAVIHYDNLYEVNGNVNKIKTFIDLSLKNKIKISVLAPVPHFPMHIPLTMYKKNNNDEISLNKKEHLNMTKGFWNFIEKISSDEVLIYDPSKILCLNKKSCSYQDSDQTPLYYDSNHLTLTGASKLAPLFQKIINEIK